MFLLASANKVLKRSVTCIAVLMGLYILAFRYGPPSPGVVVSLLNTDVAEVLEFLWQTPAKEIFLLLIFVTALGVYVRTDSWLEKNLPSYRLLYVLVAVNLFLWGDGAKFTRDGFSAVQSAWGYQQKLLNEPPPDWKISRLPEYEKYKNYVVVVGESVRLDVSLCMVGNGIQRPISIKCREISMGCMRRVGIPKCPYLGCWRYPITLVKYATAIM